MSPEGCISQNFGEDGSMDDSTTGSGPEAEVVEICRDLIRIDTSNYGTDEGPGERKAAELVATLLDDVGIEARIVETAPSQSCLPICCWTCCCRVPMRCSI